MTIIAVNDKPATVADSRSTDEDTPLTFAASGLTLNDTDPEGNTMTVTAVANGALGTAALAGGSITYTPDLNANGADAFTYTVSDGQGGIATGTVNVTIIAVNDRPTITHVLDQAARSGVAVGPLGLTVGDVETAAAALIVSASSSNAALVPAGNIVLAGSGAARTVTITSAANQSGTAVITLTVTDGNGEKADDTFVLTVTPSNAAPVASAQSVGTVAGTAVAITLTGSDADGDALSYSTVSGPAHGTLSGTGRDRSYMPAAGYTGPDNFTFTVNDGKVDSAAATVSITVNPAIATATTLSSPTANPTTYGVNVVLNATVSSSGGSPTGSVEFFDGTRSLGSANLSGGTATLTTGAIGVLTPGVTAQYRPTGSFGASTSAPLARTVTKATATTTITMTPLSQQYSDAVTFKATMTPASLGGRAPAEGVRFKVGTQVMGTDPMVPWVLNTATGALEATLVAPLTETIAGQLKPGSKVAMAEFMGVDPNVTVANKSLGLTVRQEDAARTAYTGPAVQLTTCPTCGTATVRLEAKVWEEDATPGDARNATMTFVDRATGLSIGVGTLDTTKSTAATAYYFLNWSVDIGTAASKAFTIGMLAGNYYVRNNVADNGTLTVRKTP
jgi:hypothetical protein